MAGPFSKVDGPYYNAEGQRSYYRSSTWYTSPKTDRSPHWYQMQTGYSSYNDLFNDWAYVTAVNGEVLQDQAYNKAYAKLVEQVLQTDDVANEALFKIKETMDLIAHRADSIRKLAKNFSQAAKNGKNPNLNRKTGSGKTRDSGVGAAKDLGSLWLEYHFGWTNLMHDIFRFCEVLNQKFPVKHLHGRGSESWEYKDVFQYNAPTTAFLVESQRKYTIHAEVGLKFTIDNPNLHLLQQMGLANPLAIAWALVPYSFVVDWFIDVQSYLLGYTDFVGLNLTDQYTTFYRTATNETKKKNYYSYYDGRWHKLPDEGGVCSAGAMDRRGGVSPPRLAMKRMKNLSTVRAATAISLLVGFLKSH